MKVSIIVPVYNVEKYLDRCLNSLVHQTLKEIEILVVNDGTKDNSQEIIDKYVKMDQRVIPFKKKNGGLSDARNYALPHVRGEYIAFVDSDDYVEETMYEKMYQEAIRGKYDMVECDFIWEYPDRQVIDHSNVEDNYFTDIRVPAWNKLYKTELVKEKKIKFPKGLHYEDIVFCYELLPWTENVGYVKEPLYHYIQRDDSIANTQDVKVRELYDILKIVFDYYKKHHLLEKYKAEIEYVFIRYIFGRSFYRISSLEDKKLRKQYLDEGYHLLNETFPHWKKNHFLKTKKGIRNFYYRHMNRSLYYLSAKLFHTFGKLILRIPKSWR